MKCSTIHRSEIFFHPTVHSSTSLALGERATVPVTLSPTVSLTVNEYSVSRPIEYLPSHSETLLRTKDIFSAGMCFKTFSKFMARFPTLLTSKGKFKPGQPQNDRGET